MNVTDNININIEVAYAKPEEQVILAINVTKGTTVDEAIIKSGILSKFSEIDIANSKVGIFGKAVKNTTVLNEGDRVEIYRPLIADPKEVRRQRAEQGKVMKKGGGSTVES